MSKCKYSKIVGQYSYETECTKNERVHGDI